MRLLDELRPELERLRTIAAAVESVTAESATDPARCAAVLQAMRAAYDAQPSTARRQDGAEMFAHRGSPSARRR